MVASASGGHLLITAIKGEHVAGIYEEARLAGKSLSHLRHLRAIMRSRFDVAMAEDMIQSNPMARVKIPKAKIDRRERAVLTDTELFIYLSWQHPVRRFQLATATPDHERTGSHVRRAAYRESARHLLPCRGFVTLEGTVYRNGIHATRGLPFVATSLHAGRCCRRSDRADHAEPHWACQFGSSLALPPQHDQNA